jgi:hypothetical protein
MSGNAKLIKLIEYLGDLREYEFTGLIIDQKIWIQHWKSPKYQLGVFKNLPEFRTHCPCSTKIVKNCLIRHISTGRLEFIGYNCAEEYRMMRKLCVDCNEVNRCKTNRCADCRD